MFDQGTPSIFSTQADQRFNSFSDPMNSVNQSSGNWGVNPAYLTPAHLSPYRPPYQGPTGEMYGSYKPSWGESANQIFNPFAKEGDNYGGNTWQQQSPQYDALFKKPMHGTASLIQNYVVPMAATYGAYRWLGGASSAIGRGAGQGLARGLAGGLTVGQTGSAMAAGGAVGSVLGGMILPMVAAEVGVKTIDKALFEPYIAQAKTGESLRENFGGVTFGEKGVGDLYTGGGISRRMAQHIAKNVSLAGATDRTFTQEETSQLADFASRSGLLDNANVSQMSARFEGILKQVKIVMAVANTSDFKETIEIMAKLQRSGMSPTELPRVMAGLAGHAAISGQSVQKLLNTIGVQSQVMFGQAGLTPYVGTKTGFEANASMSAAFRNNLISPALMARMGGVEGATQSAVGAQIAMYKTPYANMMAHNSYFGGGEMGTIVGNMAKFGGGIAGNPLENAGNFARMGDALASKHLSDEGLYGVQRMVGQIADVTPSSKLRNGKVGGGAAYMIMTNAMGMTPDQANASLLQLRSFQDDKTYNQMLAGNSRARKEAELKYLQNERLDKGMFTTPVNWMLNVGTSVQKSGASYVGGIQENVGDIADRFQNLWTTSLNRIDKDSKDVMVDDLNQNPDEKVLQIDTKLNSSKNLKKGIGRAEDLISTGFFNGTGSRDLKTIDIINKLAAESGDKNAKLAISSSGKEREDALYKLARSHPDKFKDEYTGAEGNKRLAKSMDILGINDNFTKDPAEAKTIKNTLGDRLEKILPNSSASEAVEFIGLMEKVRKADADNTDLSKKTLERIAQLKPDFINLSKVEQKELALKIGADAAEKGVDHWAAFGPMGSLENMEAFARKNNIPVVKGSVKKSADDAATIAQSELQNSFIKQHSNIVKLRKNGIIDDTAAMNAITSLDNNTATGAFSEAVTRFGEYVSVVSKKSVDTSFKPTELLNKDKASRGRGY